MSSVFREVVAVFVFICLASASGCGTTTIHWTYDGTPHTLIFGGPTE